MSFRSPAQQLADQYDEDTAGLYREPTLDELNEERDDAFRHFDTYVFARTASLTGRWEWDRANGGATVDGEPAGGAPTSYPAHHAPKGPSPGCAGGEVTGTSGPTGTSGLAFSFEHLMWTA